MAGGLAHEINNPLAIISGYASRVRDLVGSLPTANLDEQELKAHTRAIEIANRIEATTLRIATIVKGLRAISRDGSQDEKELVNAKDIIDETLGLCVEHFRNEGISLEFEVYEDLWVQCRRVQISQVVLNLLSNSFFAVSNQEKKLIRIMAKRTEDMFELAIEDSGPGVPLEVREKIFQPFFTTKPVGKGTGLGLSIAASLVRDHGGDILLDESAPVTRFVMRLPLATETKPSPQFTGMH
jgi:C4-dicarboxylate-specific signal transduction histidine kinase